MPLDTTAGTRSSENFDDDDYDEDDDDTDDDEATSSSGEYCMAATSINPLPNNRASSSCRSTCSKASPVNSHKATVAKKTAGRVPNTNPAKQKSRLAPRNPFAINRERSVQSYQIHPDIKNDIADILELIRIEIKKCPERHIQVRNRTAASITKRYLYECDLKKLQRCLEDANRLLEKYRAANALKYASTVATSSSASR